MVQSQADQMKQLMLALLKRKENNEEKQYIEHETFNKQSGIEQF
jgi:hypothetical protein